MFGNKKAKDNNSLLIPKEAALKEKNILAFNTYFPEYQNETLDACFRCYYLNLMDNSADYHLFLHIIGMRNGNFKLIIPWSSILSMKYVRKRSKIYGHNAIEITWKKGDEAIVISNFIKFTNIELAFRYLSLTLSNVYPEVHIATVDEPVEDQNNNGNIQGELSIDEFILM